MMWLIRTRLAALLVLAALAGCKGPCQELAENICLCKPTERARQSCVVSVKDETGRLPASDEQEMRCADLLLTCDEEHVCELLEEDDLEACGLATY